MLQMPLGPVMVDIAGLSLTPDEVKRLQHPLVGGVILFARNYASPVQLKALTASIHALRAPALLIAVDHEGGRVQRFREGFTVIPPMRAVGEQYDIDQEQGCKLAYDIGLVIGSELLAHGVDFSFAPVLDLDWGGSTVIGHRAFHVDPMIVTELAGRLIDGLSAAGVVSVGKHFPGHGYVQADSHHDIPVDNRPFAEIEKNDMVPFHQLVQRGLAAVMPAHVTYPEVDHRPAGFSPVWLQEILRKKLGFEGIIFSDDLSMEGASVAGNVTARAHAAMHAGCDMVLICNNPVLADELLQGLTRDGIVPNPALSVKLCGLHKRECASDASRLQAARRHIVAFAKT